MHGLHLSEYQRSFHGANVAGLGGQSTMCYFSAHTTKGRTSQQNATLNAFKKF